MAGVRHTISTFPRENAEQVQCRSGVRGETWDVKGIGSSYEKKSLCYASPFTSRLSLQYGAFCYRKRMTAVAESLCIRRYLWSWPITKGTTANWRLLQTLTHCRKIIVCGITLAQISKVTRDQSWSGIPPFSRPSWFQCISLHSRTRHRIASMAGLAPYPVLTVPMVKQRTDGSAGTEKPSMSRSVLSALRPTSLFGRATDRVHF